MNMEARNQRFSHKRMRRAGALVLALMMLTLPIAAADEFILTSGVDPSGPVHGGGYATLVESEPFALTGGVDPIGPVHGGGYAASVESELFALTSGVDPSGPVHGSSLSCLELSELDMVC